MLGRKLGLVFRKQWVKYLSTNLSPKPVNELSEQIILEDNKENEILRHPDYFNVHNLFTIKDLFDAKVHYGHHESSLTRNMKPFVFGSRLGHVIFDLDTTAYHLREALNFTAHIAYRNGIILFISKNPRMTLLVENTAKACDEYAVTREWMLGTLSNPKRCKFFVRLPDLCIFLNTIGENSYLHYGITEAAKMCIPTVGIVDSNCNPNLITYPVPGNDDSYSCFQLYCKLFKEAILRGKSERQKQLMLKCITESSVNTVQGKEEISAETKSVLVNEETIVNTNTVLDDKKMQNEELKLENTEFDMNINNENVKEK